MAATTGSSRRIREVESGGGAASFGGECESGVLRQRPVARHTEDVGAGNLVVSSVEGSNVDIASEFSQLIVAQQAYSSNAKVVTTANAMLQVTINMIS